MGKVSRDNTTERKRWGELWGDGRRGGKVKATFEVEGQGEVAPCGVSTAGWVRDARRRTGLGRRVRGVGCGVSAGRVKPKLRFSASLSF